MIKLVVTAILKLVLVSNAIVPVNVDGTDYNYRLFPKFLGRDAIAGIMLPDHYGAVDMDAEKTDDTVSQSEKTAALIFIS